MALYRNAWPVNSDSPTNVRFGYILKTTPAISPMPMGPRCLTRIVRRGGMSSWPVDATTWCSMPRVTRSASASWPCRNSQRGLSGTLRRTSRMATAITAARPKAIRQPTSRANRLVLSSSRDASEPRIVPIQNDPPMIRSTALRTRAGISSSTAEWIAEYSPPTPAPVMRRHARNHTKFMENAVSTLPLMKISSVSMNSFLRPILSARRPKYSAPRQAPRMYAEPAEPTSAAVSSSPEPSSVRRPPIAPTIVTARPSRIQTVPRPMITIQCQRDQGRRSSRAGMLVSIVRREAASDCAMGPSPQRSVFRAFDYPGQKPEKPLSRNCVRALDARTGDGLGLRLVVGLRLVEQAVGQARRERHDRDLRVHAERARDDRT